MTSGQIFWHECIVLDAFRMFTPCVIAFLYCGWEHKHLESTEDVPCRRLSFWAEEIKDVPCLGLSLCRI